MKPLLPVILLVGACASAPAARPVVPESRRAEQKPLPADPAQEALPEGLAAGEWAVPVEAGECVPVGEGEPAKGPCPVQAGVLISERKAARVALYKIRYVELRRTVEADRIAWGADRELYETKLQLALDEIEELQPTWWDENKGTALLAVGFLAGGIIAVVVAHAMADAVPDTVTVEGM